MLYFSSKRRCVPAKSLKVLGKMSSQISGDKFARRFVLFSSLFMQHESMSVTALSRLLETVAKSIKHATAMSTILATELFQARRDAALATSKLLLENLCYETYRMLQLMPKSLFDNKIKEVAKANYEGQQQRFLASSLTNTNLQKQKMAYLAPTAFKRPRQPNKPSRLNRHNLTDLKIRASPFCPVLERTIQRRVVT